MKIKSSKLALIFILLVKLSYTVSLLLSEIISIINTKEKKIKMKHLSSTNNKICQELVCSITIITGSILTNASINVKNWLVTKTLSK